MAAVDDDMVAFYEVSEVAEPQCASGRTEHCWHMSLVQHAMDHHQDEDCCWCTVKRCLSFTQEKDNRHGPQRLIYRNSGEIKVTYR